MVRNCVLLVWIATAFSDAFPTSYVKFVRNYGNTKGATTDSKSQGSRSPRSYFYSFDSFNPLEEIWSDDIFIPSDDLLHFGFQPTNGHVTPDFSNGLDYPDPLLLTGTAAKFAVEYLYGKGELFFDDIPHVRALLYNQKQREENGLAGNVLGSLRPVSPFHRYRFNKKNPFFN